MSDAQAHTPHILVANIHFAPFTYGGATIVAEEVARDLAARGAARISALSLINRPELAPYTVIRAQVDGIDNYMINVGGGRDYAMLYDNPQIEDVMAGLIADLAPDLVHVHCIQEVGIGLLRAVRAAKLPLVLTVHDFWWICERQFMIRPEGRYCAQSPVRIEACKGCVDDWAAARTRFEALSEAARLADLVTYPSQFALDLCEASGLAPGQGQVWENGVHLPGDGFAGTQAARRARDGRLTFGFVGGPSQIKGWPLIRAAFAGLSRSDFRVHLVEATRDGSWWKDQDLSDLPGTWEVIPRFDQSGMDDFYAGIDVLLFLSQWKETFGLTIREALARGIPVIQTDSGGTTEHGALPPEALIPIGAPASTLQSALEQVLDAGPAPVPEGLRITGFADQARAFEDLIAPLFRQSGPERLQRPAASR